MDNIQLYSFRTQRKVQQVILPVLVGTLDQTVVGIGNVKYVMYIEIFKYQR